MTGRTVRFLKYTLFFFKSVLIEKIPILLNFLGKKVIFAAILTFFMLTLNAIC